MEAPGHYQTEGTGGRNQDLRWHRISGLIILGVAGLWFMTGDRACGAPGKKSSGVQSSFEVFDAPVKKVFSTTNGNHRFVAYLVDRDGSEVIVSDTLARSRFTVGDSISVIAHKVTIEKAANDVRSLSFSLSGASVGSGRVAPSVRAPSPVRAPSRPGEVRPSRNAGGSKEDQRRMRYIGGDLTAARTDNERYLALGRAAKSALKAGRSAEAGKLAKELLSVTPKYKGGWNYGNAIHDGNQVLGQIALAAGDFEVVEMHLLASVESKGSPQLNSFGPSMTVANGLLARGGQAAVLRYLERCQTFWTSGKDRLAEWMADIKAGRQPAFGHSLK
jgi:hypothetical protein